MEEKELHITRRHLPHWRIEGATYFITFRTRELLLTPREQEVVLDRIKESHKVYYSLAAAVVMPDHVHMILTPNAGCELERIMKGIKGPSARKINILRGTTGSVWQDESFDRIIRDQDEFEEKLRYMFSNAMKNGLTDDPWNYYGWFCAEE
ncbi:MAG: transposase [Bacteroidota bacterium]